MTAVRLLFLVGAALLALNPLLARAAGPRPGFHKRTYKDADGNEFKYQVFVPYCYKGGEGLPVILFLHGAGETGKDGEAQVRVGLGPAIRRRAKMFPFFAVFPQSQDRTWRADSADAKRALAILAEVEKEYKTDPHRVYLTGLSMGGFGTWSLAAKYPDRWAAIAPVCGGGDPKSAAKIKDVPCWCFHGGADEVVSPGLSRRMLAALWEAGGHPNYTEYPGVGHNSWDKAYATADLYEWLLSFERK